MTDARPWRPTWSPSRLRAAMTCEALYAFTYGTRGWGLWRTPGNWRTEFGGHAHASLAVFDYWRALGMGKADAREAALDYAFKRTWGWESPSSKMNRRNLVRHVEWYTDDQPENVEDGWKPDVTAFGPNLEVALSIPLGTTTPDDAGHRLECIFDGLGRWGGVPAVLERKFTEGDIGPGMAARYSPDVQIDAEDLVAVRSGRMPGESRAYQLVVEAHQIGVNFSRHYAWPVDRTEEQREECLNDIEKTIVRTETHARALEQGLFDRVEMNRSACSQYGGCAMRPVCARQPALRGEYLSGGVDKSGARLYVKDERHGI